MLGYCQSCKKHVELVVDPTGKKHSCIECGTPISMPSVSHLNPGTVINGFLVESKLGQGGMGVVYKAKQLNLERYVALKVLSDELSRDTEFVERFFKEARAAASLSHSNIVQVYDAGSTLDGIYYFAMELIEGETLDTRITRDGLVPPKDAIDIAGKIASALEYAWERQKLCHGDIKPDNIILNSSGGAKLADLGLAKSILDEKSFKDGLMATPLYAPPEVIAGDLHRIDCRSDMYSFGATMYHMLAGTPPFMADDPDAVMKKHLNEKPVPLIQVNKELSQPISNMVDHLLAKNPENRPSSWKDICKTLEKIHDAERKIFHKAAFSPKANAIPGAAPQYHREEVQADPLARLIKSLVVAVLLLAALAVTVFIYLESKKKAPGKGTAATSTQQANPKEALDKEWQKLKADLPKVDPDYAINLIQEFVKKHPSDVPEDADKILQDLKQKLIVRQKNKEEAEKKNQELQNEVKALRGIITSVDITKEKKDKLEEYNKRIEAVLQTFTKNKDLQIDPESKNILNQGFLKISDALTKIRLEEERIAQEEEQKKEQERLEKEKKRLAEEEKQRQERLAQNKLVDDYYLALGDFMAAYAKKKDAAVLKDLLDTVLNENKKTALPESFLNKIKFLKETVIPSEQGLYGVFEKNEAVFKGKPMPGVPKDISGHEVERISDRTIKLMTKIDKVKMGKTLSWDQLTPETVVQSLQQRILAPESGIKLSKQEASAVLTFCLFGSMNQQFADFMKSFSCFTAPEKKTWDVLCDDFKKAQDERKAIEIWRDFSAKMKAGEIFDASHLLIDMSSTCKDTDMFRRYAEEIAYQFLSLQPLLPELQALQMLELASQDIKNSKFIPALEKAMSANARCANVKNPHPSIKEKIKGIQDQALSAMTSASSIKNISDNRIPFYYWEAETPGDAWIYEHVVRGSGKINSKELLSSMSVGSLIDIGNWQLAATTVRSGKLMDSSQLLEIKGNLMFWVPSFIFAQGMIEMNYGTWDAQMEALSGLHSMSQNFKQNPMGPMNALTTDLAMEYALMLHAPVKASDIASTYAYGTTKADREIRIALLHLLASLQRSDLPKDEYSKALKKVEDQFKQYPEFANDLNWCRTAAWILEDTRNLGAKRQQFLREAKCTAPDICARIMTAAVARAYAAGPGFESDKDLFPLIEAQISGNTVSSELWRQLTLLKIARSGKNPNSMLRQIKDSLNEAKFCSIPFYPKICMMKTGLDLMAGKISPKDAEKMLKYLLDASSVASDADKASVDVISSQNPVAMVSGMVSENRITSAYWCGVLGIMAHYKNKKLIFDIVKVLEENGKLLTWDERLLLKVLVE